MKTEDIMNFYTIHKREMNFFLHKMVDKKHRFYTRVGKKIYFPPTCRHVLKFDKKEFVGLGEGKLGFKQKELTKEVQERFRENIEAQNKCIEIIRKRAKEYRYYSGIIRAKTGKGKSHIIMSIIEEFQMPTLILVSNRKLMFEMLEKIKEFSNMIPSQYGDGKKEIGDITIMTKTSFGLCDGKSLERFKVVLVDEMHQGFTKGFRNKINISFEQIIFYGLSATPQTDELNIEDMEKYYGKVFDVGSGYDFIPKFVFFNYHANKVYEHETYQEHRTLLAEDMDRYEMQIRYIEENLTKCSLILCDRLAEIENFVTHFYKTDYNVVKITGETDVTDDQNNLRRSIGIKTIIVGSIQKCATGFDHPPIDSVFIFSSIKFENTVIQSIGRALRKYEGKTGVTIYVWNDKSLDGQRRQKEKAIMDEYGVSKNDIINVMLGERKKKENQPSLVI